MRKKTKQLISLLTVSVLVFTMLAGCGNRNAGSDEFITIGVMAPLSGPNAYFGRDMINSFRLAVHDINEDGGVLGKQFRLIEVDDGGDPNMAITAAANLISRDVDFVAGGYGSGALVPTMQMFYDENLILMIANSNSTMITELGFNQSFMVNSPGNQQIETLVDLLKLLDGVQSVALVHQGCAFSRDLSDISQRILPQNGFSIATVQVTEVDAPDVSAVATAIMNSGADFVFWCAYHADGANLIRQLRRQGYTGYICVADGSASADLITFTGTDGDGVYVLSPPSVEVSAGVEGFVASFTEMFNANPSAYATLSYDTIRILAAAIEIAGTTEMTAVRNAIQNIEYNGLSGTTKFTADREPEISKFVILQIQDGAFWLVAQ
jgi:branched-chain amino acid transport system substrate-binding protein